jgi:hypothetical protein
MKIREAVNLILTAFLLPFSIAWFFEVFPYERYPVLYTALVVGTVTLVLALIIHILYRLAYWCEPVTRLRCFLIARMVDRPVKKLQRIITTSRNFTVVESALAGLRELTGKEKYLAIVKAAGEKQKDEGKKRYLQENYALHGTEERQ